MHFGFARAFDGERQPSDSGLASADTELGLLVHEAALQTWTVSFASRRIAATLDVNNERRARHWHVVVAQLNRVSSGLERRVENLVDLIVLCDDFAGNIFAFRIGNGARQLACVNLMTQLAHVNLEVCLSIHHDACKLRKE